MTSDPAAHLAMSLAVPATPLRGCQAPASSSCGSLLRPSHHSCCQVAVGTGVSVGRCVGVGVGAAMLDIGWSDMELGGLEARPVYVVFGTDSDRVLLGAMALEAFALAADAKNRRLIPAELTL